MAWRYACRKVRRRLLVQWFAAWQGWQLEACSAARRAASIKQWRGVRSAVRVWRAQLVWGEHVRGAAGAMNVRRDAMALACVLSVWSDASYRSRACAAAVMRRAKARRQALSAAAVAGWSCRAKDLAAARFHAGGRGWVKAQQRVARACFQLWMHTVLQEIRVSLAFSHLAWRVLLGHATTALRFRSSELSGAYLRSRSLISSHVLKAALMEPEDDYPFGLTHTNIAFFRGLYLGARPRHPDAAQAKFADTLVRTFSSTNKFTQTTIVGKKAITRGLC